MSLRLLSIALLPASLLSAAAAALADALDVEFFMTTPRDLLIVTMDMPSSRPVERGDLSLALAGAELFDLLVTGAVRPADGLLVPTDLPAEPPADPLLDEAAASLTRQPPYEPVADWLWRRGRGLSAAYLAALESEQQLVRQRSRRWVLFRSSRMVLVDSPARRRAAHRWAADEPVLATLAVSVGIHDRRPADAPTVTSPAVATILAAVADALTELADERLRRARKLTDAAVNNVRRGY